MRTYLDCVPCILSQALSAARMVSTEPAVHERILRETLRWTGDMDMKQPAPVMVQRIHRLLRETTGREDPYRDAKNHQNQTALALVPELSSRIEAAADPLTAALRVAIAGNAIDMGANGNVAGLDVRKAAVQALTGPLVGEVDGFRTAVEKAERILYLTDNAGEVAFDCLLIKQLLPARVTAVVRGKPVINDATTADARAVGLDRIVEVIDNGSDAPGTLLEDCSLGFRRRFAEADLVIAKGQGNYETLSEDPHDIFFLFRVKCSMVAARTGVPIGANVLAHSKAGITKGASRQGGRHRRGRKRSRQDSPLPTTSPDVGCQSATPRAEVG
jgi:uncharacterized protein with ATP-grasp and redox domains